jgi:hypothetical protein
LDSIPSGSLGLFLSIIISGGIVAGLFEFFRNWIIQRRQEHWDISKIKLGYIDKSLPYFGQMQLYCQTLADYLKAEDHDRYNRIIMYYTCNILRLKDEHFRKFGAVQLDNVNAETVLESLLRDFEVVLIQRLGSRSHSMLLGLINATTLYHEFEDKLSKHDDLIQVFKSKVLCHEISVKELEKKSRYYAELIYIEINHIYRVVYGKEYDVKLSTLSPDTLRYLKKHYNDYYSDRIKKLYREPRLRGLRTMPFLHKKL